MKKFILSLVLLILIISSASGQELRPKVAFDYFPNKSGYAFKLGDEIAKIGRYRTRIGLDFVGKVPINKKFIRDIQYTAFTDVYSHMNFSDGGKFSFTPTLMNFYIGANIQYKKFKLEYKHLCTHPTKTDGIKSLNVYGGYDMISISYGY